MYLKVKANETFHFLFVISENKIYAHYGRKLGVLLIKLTIPKLQLPPIFSKLYPIRQLYNS